jgi:hypothetical protein
VNGKGTVLVPAASCNAITKRKETSTNSIPSTRIAAVAADAANDIDWRITV